jgi:hypothetical protein
MLLLDQVEQSARRRQSRNVVRPPLQIAKPAEDAVRGEHDVERALEAVCRVLDVACDELGLDLKLLGEGASRFDGLGEKSIPTTGPAPSFTHDIVSMPVWHWRWTRLLPATRGGSSVSSIGWRLVPWARSRARNSSSFAWMAATASLWARLTRLDGTIIFG